MKRKEGSGKWLGWGKWLVLSPKTNNFHLPPLSTYHLNPASGPLSYLPFFPTLIAMVWEATSFPLVAMIPMR